MVVAFKNVLRQHRVILYRLKRNFGTPVTFDEITSLTHNLRTGVKTVGKTVVSLRKAIVLPGDLSKKFSYDLTFIAGNNNFTYGALFDEKFRSIIVEKKDLPAAFNLELDYYINIDGDRYAIKSITKDSCNIAYLFVANRLEGQ